MILVCLLIRVTWLIPPYLSLEDLAVGMIVSAILPPLNSSAINMRRKSEMLVAGWADLDTVTISEWDGQIN